jgi:hypothetical protein
MSPFLTYSKVTFIRNILTFANKPDITSKVTYNHVAVVKKIHGEVTQTLFLQIIVQPKKKKKEEWIEDLVLIRLIVFQSQSFKGYTGVTNFFT